MTDVSPPSVDPDQLRRTTDLYRLRTTITGIYPRLALERKIKEMGGTVRMEARKLLYPSRQAPLTSMAQLTAMEGKLLTGALEQPTVDAAVRQIYDNMFTLTGWLYKAAVANQDGVTFTQGGEVQGMCESYRNAFHEALKCYDALRANRQEGDLTIEEEQSLASEGGHSAPAPV